MSGSAKEKQKPQIMIDLDQLGGAPEDITGDKEFLHSDAFDRVLEIIGKPPSGQSDAARRYEPARRPASLDVLEDRKHDAVMISARRGEGKTTLLVSLMRSIENGTYKKRRKHEEAATLYSLGLIDPTLIESKQNVIIAVVSRISDAVLHHRENCQHHRSHDEEFETTKKAMRRLADGLKLLDGVGDDKLHGGVEWDDADYIMDEGLHKASAAYALERNLREYVSQAAQYLKVDAFVLAIDDADTLFERGWPVLEALRKYLTIPKLRIVISGDIELFTELVRRKQWEQVGKDFLNAEARLAKARDEKSRIRELGYMVGELQDQYLVKLLPPERRIVLKSLTAKSRQADIVLKFSPSGKGTAKVAIDIDEFAKRFANLLMGLRSREAVDLIKNRLLELPTRSAVQLLSGVTPLVGENKYSIEHAEAALDRIRHVATSALIDCRLSAEDTRDPIADPLLPRLSEWLTYSVKWSSFSRFYPDAVDDDEGNLTQLFLGALLHHVFIVNPGKMIEYWLRIAMVRVWLDQGNFPGGEPDPDKAAEALDRWMDVKAQDTTLPYVSKFLAWTTQDPKDGIFNPGVRFTGTNIPYGRVRGVDAAFFTLYGLFYSNGTNKFDREQYKRLTSISYDGNSIDDFDIEKLFVDTKTPYLMRAWHRKIIESGWNYASGEQIHINGYFLNSIGNIMERISGPGFFSTLIPSMLIFNSTSSAFGFYSFFRLISVIGELCEIPESLGEQECEEEVRAVIIRSSAIRTYPTPSKSGGTSSVRDRNPSEDIDDTIDSEAELPVSEDDDRGLTTLVGALTSWIRSHPRFVSENGQAIAPVTLARMWTRFAYAVENIIQNLRVLESRYLGVLFHRTTIAFLHAVGVEAARAAEIRLGASVLSNPVTSGAVFVGLLRDMEKLQGTPEGRFFDFLFSCPLWGFFLARTEADEVEKARPGSPNNKIFEVYTKSASGRGVDPSIWQVKVYEPGNTGNSATFDGLFHILNTVYMQGLSIPPRPKNNQSNKPGGTQEEAEAAEAKPRRAGTRGRPPNTSASEDNA